MPWIDLSDAAIARLNQHRKDGESISDVIIRFVKQTEQTR